MGVAGMQRIEKFRSETTAVIEYYEGKGVLRKVGAAETDCTVGCLVSIHQCNVRYCRCRTQLDAEKAADEVLTQAREALAAAKFTPVASA